MRRILWLIRTLLWPLGILLHWVLHRREPRSSPEFEAEITKLNALVQRGELTPEEWLEAVEKRLSSPPTEGKLRAPILWLIGILLAPVIILVRWLESRRGPKLSEERFAELVERSQRGELTLPELLEALGKPVGNLPREGEVPVRELCEALGWPLSKVPRGLWDNSVPIPKVGPVKVVAVRKRVTRESLAAKAKATLSEILVFGVVIYRGARRRFKR